MAKLDYQLLYSRIRGLLYLGNIAQLVEQWTEILKVRVSIYLVTLGDLAVIGLLQPLDSGWKVLYFLKRERTGLMIKKKRFLFHSCVLLRLQADLVIIIALVISVSMFFLGKRLIELFPGLADPKIIFWLLVFAGVYW